MPWSVKAEDLLKSQYAPTGAAATAMMSAAQFLLAQASQRGIDVAGLSHSFANRAQLVRQYVDAYRHYCWPVTVERSKVGSYALRVTAKGISWDVGRGRAASRDLPDHTSDA